MSAPLEIMTSAPGVFLLYFMVDGFQLKFNSQVEAPLKTPCIMIQTSGSIVWFLGNMHGMLLN